MLLFFARRVNWTDNRWTEIRERETEREREREKERERRDGMPEFG